MTQARAPHTQPFGSEAFQPSAGTELRRLVMAGFLINSRGTTVMIDPLLGDFDLPVLIDFPLDPTSPPFNGDPAALADRVANPGRIIVLAPGEPYRLHPLGTQAGSDSVTSPTPSHPSTHPAHRNQPGASAHKELQ